ncbi:MAG: hypothetical protein NZ518_01025 [Dehalococcoidia bacterium]|nr:hypothetical protein [Dehalococcoidia bacterium]
MGRVLGLIFLVVGIAICGMAALFVGTGLTSNQVTVPGAVLGVGLFGVIPLLMFGGVGAYLYQRGVAEEAELADIRKKQRLLGLIQAQGEVSLENAMVELKMNRKQIETALYDLVSQGLFSGYIDWKKKTFYSQDAALVGSAKCPNCGGQREVAGKGIVTCPFCGVSLFIPAA